jgi:HflK protein
MFSFVASLVKEIFILYYEAAIYILFGFTLAGLIRVFFRSSTIHTYLGKEKYKAIFRSSLFGIPLPLCSCSVLPTAISLRKSGANKGAATSFLISTPEVGIDSIMLTYGLMGGVMAFFRPLAAFLTAVTAGLLIEYAEKSTEYAPAESTPEFEGEIEDKKDGGKRADGEEAFPKLWRMSYPGMKALWKESFGYAFGELFHEISWWLVFGFVLSGIITITIPDVVFTKFLSGNLALFVMLIVGIPMYVCASSSTPIAAAMLIKGLSPGAAIVFLLAGPATNLGSLMILKKFLGKRSLAIYMATIVVMTLLFGFLINAFYPDQSFPVKTFLNPIEAENSSYIKLLASILLFLLIARSFMKSTIPKEWIHYNNFLYELTHFKFTKFNATALIVLFLLTAYLSTCLLIVQPGQLGFIRRFGKIERPNLTPGIYLHLPLPIDKDEVCSVTKIRKINIGFEEEKGAEMPVYQTSEEKNKEALLITGDENIIDVNYAVQYDIQPEMAFKSLYLISELDNIIKSITIEYMIKTIGSYPIDAVYTTERSAVEDRVKQLVQEKLDRLEMGVRILQINLVYVHAPRKVHYYFRDVASAQEDMNRCINLAEVYATEKVNLSKGNGEKIINEAESCKKTMINTAQGESESFERQRQSFILAPDLTRLRLYLETLEEVLPGLRKYIKPPRGKIDNIDIYMLDQNLFPGRVDSPEKKGNKEKTP